ncbi:hypothetical protein GQF03_07460 [Sneathiella chungangensis]|uniref:Uncharacterized protein n=1 Tax=Sneathiella chungangensis TaxID=1418234 RepID=A0A845MGJ0_9PROT|nr:hypothetical protein [Sneathiella chungangensis]MZR22164.1 hypothetical protein [Sneathiella chungangensis]
MNRGSFFLLMIWSIFFGCNASAEDQPLWKTVGEWEVRVDLSLNNGCFVLARYETGTFFRLGFNPPVGNAYIMFGSLDWQSLEHGKEYLIKIRFDDEEPWSGYATGTGLSKDLTALTLVVDEADFIREFMKKNVIVIEYRGKEISRLSLRGSFAAGMELLQCQTEFDDHKNKKKKIDPFSNHSNKKDPFSS